MRVCARVTTYQKFECDSNLSVHWEEASWSQAEDDAFVKILLAIGMLLGVTAVNAQQPTRLDSLRAEGYSALFNLDYERARRLFAQMNELEPDHPAGAQCMAASLWLQQLNESWELKATLYSDKTYAQGNAKVDARRSEEFRIWIRRAKQLSKSRLQKDRNDKEALYFLGAAEGLESAFSAAVERRFMAALRSGSNSVEHHRSVLKIDPEFHDADLTIGLYNYIVGSLPLPVKLMVSTMGVRGSKKRGLEILERVTREGKWARDVARVLLIDLYKREKKWRESVQVSRELADKYPRNYLFRLQEADALAHGIATNTNGFELADLKVVFESLMKERVDDESVLPLIHFRYGEALLRVDQRDAAAAEFRWVLNNRASADSLKNLSATRLRREFDTAKRGN